jgi:hypothetical protein
MVCRLSVVVSDSQANRFTSLPGYEAEIAWIRGPRRRSSRLVGVARAARDYAEFSTAMAVAEHACSSGVDLTYFTASGAVLAEKHGGSICAPDNSIPALRISSSSRVLS